MFWKCFCTVKPTESTPPPPPQIKKRKKHHKKRRSLFSTHLADGGLHDGVEAALGCVPVARHHLLLHLLVEAVHLVGERQDVAEAEGRHTVGEQLVSVETEVERRKDPSLFALVVLFRLHEGQQ